MYMYIYTHTYTQHSKKKSHSWKQQQQTRVHSKTSIPQVLFLKCRLTTIFPYQIPTELTFEKFNMWRALEALHWYNFSKAEHSTITISQKPSLSSFRIANSVAGLYLRIFSKVRSITILCRQLSGESTFTNFCTCQIRSMTRTRYEEILKYHLVANFPLQNECRSDYWGILSAMAAMQIQIDGALERQVCVCVCLCTCVCVCMCVCVCVSLPNQIYNLCSLHGSQISKKFLLVVENCTKKNAWNESWADSASAELLRYSRIWSSAHDFAVLDLLLNMIKSMISAWSIWPGRNDLYQLGTSFKRANQRADP